MGNGHGYGTPAAWVGSTIAGEYGRSCQGPIEDELEP